VGSHPLDPINLAVDRSDHLLVLSSDGKEASVYSLDPKGLDGAVTRIQPQPAGSHPDADMAMPVNWWANGEFRDQYDPARDEFTTLAQLFAREIAPGAPLEYVSPGLHDRKAGSAALRKQRYSVSIGRASFQVCEESAIC
jgi:hypothetical protein